MDVSETTRGMAKALLLAIDPAQALNLPHPHGGQQRVIANARRFNVIAAGRRWGKNTLAEDRIVRPALDGKPVAWFSPTYKTLAEDWRRMLDRLQPVIRDKSEQEKRIELATGRDDRHVVARCPQDDPGTRLRLHSD